MSKRLENIRRAQQITDQVFTEILKFIKSGLTEKEIARKIDTLIRLHGGDKKPAFKTLVCSGKRTALFHGPTSSKKIKKGDIVFLDFGAKYKGYCADMTRTIFIGNPSQKKFNKLTSVQIYNLILKIQQKQIQMVKAGVKVADIDNHGRKLLKNYGLDQYFIHSTGHGIGKKVHQKPRVSYKSKAILKKGEVITIEPGVYIPDFGGIRIEDILIVTKQGFINITKSNKNLILI